MEDHNNGKGYFLNANEKEKTGERKTYKAEGGGGLKSDSTIFSVIKR